MGPTDASGSRFGPAFRAVERLWCGDREALAEVRLSEDVAGEYWMHPVLLDASSQIVAATSPEFDGLYLKSRIQNLQVDRRPGRTVWAHARLRSAEAGGAIIADVTLWDEAGEVVALVRGQEARRFDAAGRRSLDGPSLDRFYETRWVTRPHPSASPQGLPDPEAIAVGLRSTLERAAVLPRMVEYEDALSSLESMTVHYVTRAFDQLGWGSGPKIASRRAELAEALGIAGQHSRLLNRLLEMLAGAGMLRRDGGVWESFPVGIPWTPERVSMEPPGIHRRGRRKGICSTVVESAWPTSWPDVVTRCTCSFPRGDVTSASRVMEESPGSAAMNGLLRDAVAAVVAAWPEGRPLRILEVGAGTGSATGYVLPVCPSGGTEYVFTDISRQFLTKARSKFAAYPFVRYETLDVERSPSDQGFGGRTFDLVIAFNVLHATRDLRKTLRHVQMLLEPGGLLLLLENTSPAKWIDLTWA